MSEAGASARLNLAQAAFVIARRDFRAVLFSKSFLFFLLGPLFFGLVSLGAASVGQRTAEQREPAALAVSLDPREAAALAAARDRIDALVPLPRMERVDTGADPAAILGDTGRNYGAVLNGSLDQPRLTGTPEVIERWRGPVALAAAAARGTGADYPAVALQPTATSGASTKRNHVGTATAAVTLMFLLTMLLAGMVMSNLVEEKANKIIEVLAAAIPMDAVFFGKLLAMLAVSFVGIAVWGGIGGALMAASGRSLAELTAPAIGWPLFAVLFLVYFALAYLLIGSIFLTIGAMAPTVRDVQTLSLPATLLQLGVFFLATYSTSDLGSSAELGAVLFPLSSPYAMASRAAQLPELWPHLVAIGWQALWVLLFVRLGARLFRRRVMQSGPQAARRRGLFRRAERTAERALPS